MHLQYAPPSMPPGLEDIGMPGGPPCMGDRRAVVVVQALKLQRGSVAATCGGAGPAPCGSQVGVPGGLGGQQVGRRGRRGALLGSAALWAPGRLDGAEEGGGGTSADLSRKAHKANTCLEKVILQCPPKSIWIIDSGSGFHQVGENALTEK